MATGRGHGERPVDRFHRVATPLTRAHEEPLMLVWRERVEDAWPGLTGLREALQRALKQALREA